MPDAGRVIAGMAAGRRLMAPGPGTRPLADRVKQTLFAILEPDLPGALVLDLFAGSGAAGIEALSRGASTAVFVDRDPGAVRVIRENLRRAGFEAGTPPVGGAATGTAMAGTTKADTATAGAPTPRTVARDSASRGRGWIVQAEALGWLRGRAWQLGPFDLAIVDPPYAETGLLVEALQALVAGPPNGVPEGPGVALLAMGARVVAKHFWRDTPPARIGLLASERSRRFGETGLMFYRLGPAEDADASRGEP